LVKTEVVYGKVEPEIKEIVKQLARKMGLTVSEYVRNLVLEDLDKRSVFTTQLKQEILTSIKDGREQK